MDEKQCEASEAGPTLFTKACLSKYYGAIVIFLLTVFVLLTPILVSVVLTAGLP